MCTKKGEKPSDTCFIFRLPPSDHVHNKHEWSTPNGREPPETCPRERILAVFKDERTRAKSSILYILWYKISLCRTDLSCLHVLLFTLETCAPQATILVMSVSYLIPFSISFTDYVTLCDLLRHSISRCKYIKNNVQDKILYPKTHKGQMALTKELAYKTNGVYDCIQNCTILGHHKSSTCDTNALILQQITNIIEHYNI